MRRLLPLFIGWRFVRSKSTNKFLSFISLISMAGLILGVAALIVITSVLNGFEEALSKKILGMVPQVAIYASEPLGDWRPLAQQIKQNDPNIIAAAPFVQARGMISLQGEVNSTILNGIEPNSHEKVSILGDSMIEGSLNTLRSGSGNIILGKYVVDKYNLSLGDEIGIIISKPSDSTVGMTPSFHTYKLSGVFHVSEELDKWMSYVAMDDVSQVLNLEKGAVGIRFNLHDVFVSKNTSKLALATASHMSKNLQNNPKNLVFYAGDWTQTHDSLYSSIRVQKTIMSLLLFLIILVAGFNVVSTLVMSVVEKKSDVAILKTFGASSKLIGQIFIIQGTIIGVIGILLGSLLGIGVSLIISSVSAWVNTVFELKLFDSYYVEALPSKIQTMDVLLIMSSTLIVVLIAVIYPSYKAASIEPVKVLNGE